MGWANCGEDDLGRPIGYAFEATCDVLGCEKAIERSVEYACGGMHGTETQKGDPCCARYFCYDHLQPRDHVCSALVTELEEEVAYLREEVRSLEKEHARCIGCVRRKMHLLSAGHGPGCDFDA
jgi:hypothetical protein